MVIIENSKEYLDQFIGLNEQWIAHYFELEDVDRNLAKNPFSIIEKGGYIFTLLVDDKVEGVCALFNDGDGVFELARMAVAAESRGKGLGGKLMEAALLKLQNIGARKVYLVSNTKLESAISLYKKYQFSVVSKGQHPLYSRANIVMERPIVNNSAAK